MRPAAWSIPALFLGFVVLWLVLDQSARALQSFRGEAGVAVAAITLAAAFALEWGYAKAPPREAYRALGLERPAARGLLGALVLSAALLIFFPVYGAVTDTDIAIGVGWPWMVLGIFAQAGIAEETVFRGFLFGHLRESRTFWRAAAIAMIPFFAVHLVLFATMSFPIALASTLLALAISFPLAHLYEISGRSIWPPAIVHFVIQGAIKIVDVPDAELMGMAVYWMALCAILPWGVFLVRPATR